MCLSPITIKVVPQHFGKGNVRGILVPCGRCEECLIKYQNSWLFRMVEEFGNHSCASFLTLTYADENIPYYVDTETGEKFNTVYVKHVQDLFKRFRIWWQREYGEKCKLVYFCTSEYGPRTLRPHYHLIIWGLRVRDLYHLINDWESRFGFVRARNIKYHQTDHYKTAKYVSKYCSKGMFENPLVKQHKVNKCSKLISKGIGLSYVDKNRSYHLCLSEYNNPLERYKGSSGKDRYRYKQEYLEAVASRFLVSLRGSKYPYSLPRYLKQKIYGKDIHLQTQISDFLFHRAHDLREQELAVLRSEHPDWSLGEAMCALASREDSDTQQRKRDLHKTLGRFYDKSKL